MISFSCGPVHSIDQAVICAPDADIPIDELGFLEIPLLTRLDNVKAGSHVLYLEGHRAPSETLQKLQKKKCTATVYGNPRCLSSVRNEEICGELMKLPEQAPHRVPETDMFITLGEAMQQSNGYTRILCSNKESKRMIMEQIRPSGEIHAGDAFFHWKHGYRSFSSAYHKNATPATIIQFQCGRSAPLKFLNNCVVETPNSWGSGVCDTLIVMPDVSEHTGYAACKRARYKVIAIGVSPSMYLTPPVVFDA